MNNATYAIKHWIILAMLLVVGTTVAGAYDLKLNDYVGNKNATVNGKLPVYGMQAGAYQKCEFVLPASILGGVNGTKIEGFTFYVEDPSVRAYFGEATVFLKEVDFTGFTEKTYSGMNGASVVYVGKLNATNSIMKIEFDTPYNYKGGNLLVGVYIEDKSGTGGSVRFFGLSTKYHTGLAAYKFDTYNNIDRSAEFVDFLPTVTFACEDRDWDLEGDDSHGSVSFTCNGETVTTSKKDKPIVATITSDEGYLPTNVVEEDGDTELTKNEDGTYSFTMPDADVKVIPNWKRDISYKVDVTEPLRFAEGDDITFELTDVLDPDDQKKLTEGNEYSVDFGEITGTGKYTATFTGNEENGYTGSFTKEFTVQKKHEWSLDAHYFGTYFYDNAIETFDDIDLATVTAVAANGTATLTKLENTQVAKKYPFLVYNPFDEKITFTLWETVEDVTPDNPTPAAQFTGTAAAKEFSAAETAAKDYYVLQKGREFVYVIGKGTKPEHRCWIELPKSAGARILTIAIDQTTGISEVKAAANAEGWYDLQGRRMTTMPTQRGLYVIDGKKVVVK